MDIAEWRGTQFNLDATTLKNLEEWQPKCDLKVALDWTPFHTNLKQYFGEDSLQEFLKILPRPSERWQEVTRQRGVNFFSFLEHWAKHVFQAIAQKDAVQWHLLPGYPTLLKAMLLEMKGRDVTKYPDALLNCSGAMLANENLLSVFNKVIFSKTSVYNSGSVFSSLNYIDYWIQVLSLREQPLPSNFDFRYLRRGLDIIFSCDIGLNIAKGIWFVYKNLPTFKGQHLKILLIDLLFDKYFYLLFLNWSWLVRRCFTWFLLYRVCETTRLVLSRDAVINSASAGGNTTSSKAPQQLVLSGEEKIMVWGYLEMSKHLARFNCPGVFPRHVAFKRLPRLLLDNLDLSGEELEGGRPRCQSDWASAAAPFSLSVPNRGTGTPADTRKLSTNPKDESGGRKDSTSATVITRRPSQPSQSKGSPRGSWMPSSAEPADDRGLRATEQAGTPRQSISRLSPPERQMVEQIKLLEENINALELMEGLPDIPAECTVYIKSAVPEFLTELQTYRAWFSSGAQQLPTMNIPASPLDNNVDVPLDN